MPCTYFLSRPFAARRLNINVDFLSAAPSTKLMPNVLLFSPLDICEAERRILVAGQSRVISIPFRRGLRPGEATSAPLFTASETTRKAIVLRYNSKSDWYMLVCYGLSPRVRETIVAPLIIYSLHQARQHSASEMLITTFCVPQ